MKEEVQNFNMKMKLFEWELKTILIWKNVLLPYTVLRKRGVRQLRNGLLNLEIYVYFGIKVWTLLETFI